MKLLTVIYFSVILAFSALSGCRPKEKCNCKISPSVEKFNDSLWENSSENYKTFILDRFGEKPIDDAGRFIIRFSIRGAFYWTKFYTIEQTGDSFMLRTRLFKRPQDENRDVFLVSTCRKLSGNEIKSIRREIKESCFWTMQSSQKEYGLDGAVFTVEIYDPEGNACTEKNFRIVSRWSPYSTGFDSLCEKIIALDPLPDNFM